MASSANLQLSKRSKSSRDWSELPVDILAEILKNASLVDRTIFRAVCKNWNLCPRIPFVSHNMPLLIWSSLSKIKTCWEFSVFSISKLKYSNRLTYTVTGPLEIGQYCRKFRDPSILPKILCTRKGWHLIQDYNRFLFFCPFNNKMINLPLLRKVRKEYVATFSGTPDEPSDCTVFVVQNIKKQNKINIATYRCGESSWRVYSYSNIPMLITRVAYIEPTLYCLSSSWSAVPTVGAFNSINNEWSIPIELGQITASDYLVESDNGELMMVRWCSYLDKFEVFSFGFAKKSWTRKFNIGSRAIYLENYRQRKTAFSVLVQGREAKQYLGNKIFYHRGQVSRCFSLETLDHQVCYQESPYCTNYDERVWIEPPKIF